MELCGRKLEHLDLSWTSLGDEVAHAIAETCGATLRILDLSGTSVTEDGVITLLQRCPRLEELSLISCRSVPREHKAKFSSAKELAALRRALIPKHV